MSTDQPAPVLSAAEVEAMVADREALLAGKADLEQGYLQAHGAYRGAVRMMDEGRRQREAAEAERDHWQQEYEDCLRVLLDHKQRADQAEAEVDRLQAALGELVTASEGYWRHSIKLGTQDSDRAQHRMGDAMHAARQALDREGHCT